MSSVVVLTIITLTLKHAEGLHKCHQLHHEAYTEGAAGHVSMERVWSTNIKGPGPGIWQTSISYQSDV